MDLRHRPIPSSAHHPQTQKLKNTTTTDSKSQPQALLPLYLTNAIFFSVFFSVAYFLLHRWREKIRTATPLHAVTPAETAAIVSLVASAVYLLGFFGVASRTSLDELSDDEIILKDDSRSPGPCPAALPDISQDHQFPLIPKAAIHRAVVTKEKQNQIPSSPHVDGSPLPPVSSFLSREDEETVEAVVSGSIPSYSLESRLGDTHRAVTIRHEAVQRLSSQSLEGLPVAGFDYDSILGQCCEMPIGFVQIPVGVAGPLLLDGKEYTVPMATTEGCLVASTNRGCKAIYVSG